MNSFIKWRYATLTSLAIFLLAAAVEAYRSSWLSASLLLFCAVINAGLFFSFWAAVRKRGAAADVEIGRILGRDAKEALNYGKVGILIYNEEYVITWQSNYFKELGLDLVNQKLTSWIGSLREMFDNNVDLVIGEADGQIFEISHKPNSQVLFVKNITELEQVKRQLAQQSVVVGLVCLDNYEEYQAYENDEILSQINTRLRSIVLAWGKEHEIFLRRLRSDRFLTIMSHETLMAMKHQNFPLLQQIKDEAQNIDVSITLSMVFAGECSSYAELDHTLSELLEIVMSRGGDQAAIKIGKNPILFIGGNSERASQRSTVRVRIVGNTIEDLIQESGKVFIAGHDNTDYDCMGAALAASNWVRELGKEPYIVLKDVKRDNYLQQTMDHYNQSVCSRHNLITPQQADDMIDINKDLVLMVDHSNPVISSMQQTLQKNPRTVIIDHHRRGQNSPAKPLLSYIESGASSSCELMTELLSSSSRSIPIYEAESTIMYLGILVDTNRFKTHTSERTFQAAGNLQAWGANTAVAEKALQEDYESYKLRNSLIEQAQMWPGGILVDVLEQPVSRTLLSQISDSLLAFKGCRASFSIARNPNTGNTAISARSDGSVNVQKIMEEMNGGGHFSAAAAELTLDPVQAAARLKEILERKDDRQ